MKKIFLLTDYKGRFGSKYYDTPYRSGFDKAKLSDLFRNSGYEAVFRDFHSLDFRKEDFNREFILYTSSEDVGYFYKSYIEDIVMALEMTGARVIPAYRYLRANNNKVFMEILRDRLPGNEFKNIESRHFGTYEDLLHDGSPTGSGFVVKTAEGASGSGVFLAHDGRELEKVVKKVSRTKNLFWEAWETGRAFKHKGYIRESKHRRKFIIQNFIPDLKNDWKIYVFGSRIYIFYRPIFKHRGFRASGGGYENYFYGTKANVPEGIFDFIDKIFRELDVPHASFDVAYDGKEFYLLEFQCVYFGTAGVLRSEEYFTFRNGRWEAVAVRLEQEQVYADSVVEYIERKYEG